MVVEIRCPKCGSGDAVVSDNQDLLYCDRCGSNFKITAQYAMENRKMQVKDLIKDVKASELERKAEKAKKILECKMRELARAKCVVAKLERDLAEFGELDLDDVDPCDYRY